MARKTLPGGGWQAIRYTLKKAWQVGPWRLWKRMRSRNACKTCALGMGGMNGGMVNEAGHFPEVCKKSLQAQVADMIGALPADYFDKHTLEDLKQLTPKQAEDAGRISYPVILEPGATKFRTISWNDALTLIAERMKETPPDQAAFYASGRSSNEAAFLLHSFARVYGSNHTMNCSYYCHQASGVGLKMALGTGTATVDLEDLSHADLVFLIGANPASNHPRLMTQLANLHARGGEVIVVNPIRESGLETFFVPSQVKSMLMGSKIATQYVQPKAGGDVAFLVGVLKQLDEQQLVKTDFLAAHTEGQEDAIHYAREVSWERITTDSGVDRATISASAEKLANAKAAIFAWAMGITHHRWGVENVLALCNLALATGHIGRKGAGVMPIRGHSNVQGIGSIGFAPSLQDGVRQALEKAYGGVVLPTTPGYDTYEMIEAADEENLQFLFNLGGNLWGSNPDLELAKRAMNNVKTTVFLSTKLNPGHFHGHGKTTLILPVFARDEEPQSTTQESMFNFVRLSEGGTPNVEGTLRAESDIICDIADRVLSSHPVDWQRLKNHNEVRKLISEIIPGWEQIGTINDTKGEFTIPGRLYHSPKFNTANGKALMHKTELPELDADTLTLMTIRSEGQFNTVVYEEYDLYRGIPHRFCVMMAEADIKRLNLKDGQRVTVSGEAGSLDNIEVVAGNIKDGVVAMFYPESNVLIKANIDPRSRTPAFKSAPVWIRPMGASAQHTKLPDESSR
ncbi:MAG: FdhF/YdeP family oxidoreductase [Candidatus Melainabacteria bacterium]|nr:FdhF/YdeP family oxidoreductase [Candidatus Melainabacteria bacterium]